MRLSKSARLRRNSALAVAIFMGLSAGASLGESAVTVTATAYG